jgi:tRNA(Ile)-lysidine synthase
MPNAGEVYLYRVQKELEAFVQRNALFAKTDRLLVAVSGGVDSMVLLHVLGQAGYNLVVAHANFKLRGAESDADEAFVREVCDTRNLPFHTHAFDTTAYANTQGLSIQMAARELRYAWFRQLAEETGCQRIATAHHRDDVTETLMLQLLRGAKPTGIPVQNGLVVRPLLFATRAQMLNHAAEHQLTWREDASNATEDYQRNKIRHSVLPVLKEINPSLEDTWQQMAATALGEHEMLQNALAHWKQSFVREQSHLVRIGREALKGWRHPATLLSHFLAPFGFHAALCSQIAAAWHGDVGKEFFSATHRLVIDREEVLLAPLAPSLEAQTLQLPEGRTQMGRLELTWHVEPVGKWAADALVACLDADLIEGPLTWRPWQAGDRLVPLGMEHPKKVSDVLVDHKVSRIEKDQTTVVCSGNNILWLVGHRIGHRYRITDATRNMLVLRLNKKAHS